MSIFQFNNKGGSGRGVARLLALLLGCSLVWSTPLRTVATDTLVLGVFPRKGFSQTLEQFTPLAEYLSRQLGREVVLRSGRNFAEFWHGVEQRQYDLVHYNQYHYVRSKKSFGYEVIAKNEEFHESTISGALLVRRDSGIETLADLRGKKVIFGGGRRAMQSYIVASYLLQEAGLQPSDYEYAFASSPLNAIFATYYRRAVAAGSADLNLQLPMIKKRIDTTQLRVLAKGEPLAHLPWAVKADLPEPLKQQLSQSLTTLTAAPEGRAALKSADLTDILPAIDGEYDAHRRMILRVLGEDYE
ncbi:MAG: PhnD/SsuA/transferrin family substrate-binding protein [Gammaproteobacteria bacterium]